MIAPWKLPQLKLYNCQPSDRWLNLSWQLNSFNFWAYYSTFLAFFMLALCRQGTIFPSDNKLILAYMFADWHCYLSLVHLLGCVPI